MQIQSAWISSPVDDNLLQYKVVGDDATYAITLSNEEEPWCERDQCLVDWLKSNSPAAFVPPPPTPAGEKLDQMLRDYGLDRATFLSLIGAEQ